jgi:hypothetical protein
MESDWPIEKIKNEIHVPSLLGVVGRMSKAPGPCPTNRKPLDEPARSISLSSRCVKARYAVQFFPNIVHASANKF